MRSLIFALFFLLSGCGEESPSSRTELSLDFYSAWTLDSELIKELLIKEFENEGIPYTIENENMESKLYWQKQYDEQVADISNKVFGVKPPVGRHFNSADPAYYLRLKSDLEKKGIESHYYRHESPYGVLEYVYWNEQDTWRVKEMIESYGIRWYSQKELSEIGATRQAEVVALDTPSR